MNELFIASGGFDGVTYLGALEYLHGNGLISDLKKFYGCSIGSLIGAYYLSGYTPRKIISELLKLDFKTFLNLEPKFNESISLVNTHKFFDEMFKQLWDIYDIEITLGEFSEKVNCDVYFNVSNITDTTYESLNNIQNPTIKLKDALRASMSVPLIFEPVKINDKLYIDGGCNNCHGVPFDNKFINGYAIIGECRGPGRNYVTMVLDSMIREIKPQACYTIICKKSTHMSDIKDSLDKIDTMLLDMYEIGINSAKEQLE